MRLRHAMLSSALQQNATLLIFFGTGIVTAHLLTPRQVGSYSVAMAAANAVAALKEVGVGSYVVSTPVLDDDLLKAAYGLSLIIAASMSAAFIGLSFPLADFYQDHALGEALRIVGLAQLWPALAFPATIRLVRAMRFGSLLAIGLVAAAAQSLVQITLALSGYGAAALAWGYFASSVVLAALTLSRQADALRLRPTLNGTRRLLGFSGWMSATLLVGSTAMSTPELMIGRILGIANAALFSRAQNLVSIIRNGMFVAMTRPLLPRLAECERNGESLAPIYLRIVEAVTGLSWPAYAVLVIWAEPLVRTLYGEAWTAAATFVAPIAIAHGLTLAVTPHYDILVVKRRPGLLFACEVAVFGFAAIALGIGLTFGLRGAIWSLIASSSFFAVCYYFVLRSVVGFTTRDLSKAWGRSLALTLVAVPGPLALRQHGAMDAVGVLSDFAISCAIAGLIWTATVILIRHELATHIGPPIRQIVALLKPRSSLRLLAPARKSTGR